MSEERYLSILEKVFHPLWIPTLLCLSIFAGNQFVMIANAQLVKAILLIVFFSTAVVPALVIPLLYYNGALSSMKITQRKDSLRISAINLAIQGTALYLMARNNFPIIIIVGVGTWTASLLIQTLLLFKWNANMVTGPWGSFLGILFYFGGNFYLNLNIIFVCALFVTGVICTTQLMNKQYKHWEVYLPVAMNFFVVWGILKFFSPMFM